MAGRLAALLAPLAGLLPAPVAGLLGGLLALLAGRLPALDVELAGLLVAGLAAAEAGLEVARAEVGRLDAGDVCAVLGLAMLSSPASSSSSMYLA